MLAEATQITTAIIGTQKIISENLQKNKSMAMMEQSPWLFDSPNPVKLLDEKIAQIQKRISKTKDIQKRNELQKTLEAMKQFKLDLVIVDKNLDANVTVESKNDESVKIDK